MWIVEVWNAAFHTYGIWYVDTLDKCTTYQITSNDVHAQVKLLMTMIKVGLGLSIEISD